MVMLSSGAQKLTLADAGGRRRRAPPLSVQILLFFHTNFPQRCHVGPWSPLRGLRPPLREILDPPLINAQLCEDLEKLLIKYDYNVFILEYQIHSFVYLLNILDTNFLPTFKIAV